MRRAIAIGVVVMALLTGCVGIPTSGGVASGPLIDEEVDPDFVLRPAGPRPGVGPEELLTDFMAALRGPQNDYATAREYFTREASLEWDPDASALVRTGIAEIEPSAAANTFDYTVTATGSVDADGRYTVLPPTPQTLTYTFAQEDGEWRIASAPNGIVLSELSFERVFAAQSLYFFDPSFAYLVPDVRWFPSRATISSRTLSALLAGPVSWLRQGVVLTAFPTATTLTTVEIEEGTAIVELSEEARNSTPVERDRMRQQLAATLDVASVVMTVGGIELVTPEPGLGAVKNPSVEAATLVGTADGFGFLDEDGVVAIPEVSAQLVAAGATAATLTTDRQAAAALTPFGVIYARVGDPQATIVDARSELAVPSVDPFRFIWSAQSASAATLTTFEVDGTEHALQTALSPDAGIVSLDVSRDGTRVLLLLSTPTGPQLVVAGIIREQGSNVPLALGELVSLPVPSSTPVDATWVDERTVAVLSRSGEISPVTLVEIGGPTESFGQLIGGTTIVGGNNGADGIRALSSLGELWRPQGGGWAGTGTIVSFLATQQ